jgi:hypothetical protein
MNREAELADGTILEFPEGTPDAVVQAAVKKHLSNQIIRETTNQKEKLKKDYRDSHPVWSAMGDVGEGASSLMRSISNRLPDGYQMESNPLADKHSKMALVGDLIDPVSTVLGGGGGKLAKVGGLLEKPILQSIAGGAMGGGAIGALSEDGSALGGATIGGALGAAIPVVGRGIGKTVDWFQKAIPDIRARNILKAFGLDSPEAVTALQNASPGVDVSQAIGSAGKVEIAALQDFANKFKPNEVKARIDSQAAARQDAMGAVAGGGSSEASIAARKGARTTLAAETNPDRLIELNAANEANQRLRELAPEWAQKQQSILSASKNEAATKGQGLNEKFRQYEQGSETQKLLKARSEENLTTADTFGQIKKQRQAESDFIANKIGSLEAHGLSPLKVNGIEESINNFLSQKGEGIKGTLNVKVLDSIKDMLRSAANADGTVDAYALHTIRKEGVNDVIENLLPVGGDKATKARAAGVVASVKDAIDKAIIDAGGTNWKDYLNKYSMGMRSIDKMKMADTLRKGSDEQLISTVGGDNTKLVEKVFGTGNTNFAEQMGDKAAPFQKAASEVARDIALAKNAQSGQTVMEQKLKDSLFSFHPPSLLNAKVNIVKSALNMVGDKVNKGAIERMSSAMQNPQEVLRIINTLPFAERNTMIQAMQDSTRTGAVTGMLTGANQ